MKKTITSILASILILSAYFVVDNKEEALYDGKSKILNSEIMSEKKKRIKGGEKFDSPDMFFAYHNDIRTPEGAEAPAYAQNYKINELNKALARNEKNGINKTLADLQWVERGPGNVGGRTRAIVVDPDDPTHHTWFVGSVGGGVWKTVNAGTSWEFITPDWPNISIGSMAMASSNHDVIYAGTGEGYHNMDAISGAGLFKTTDRGETWEQLENTIPFKCINRIVVDPTDADVLLVCYNDMNMNTNAGGGHFSTTQSGIDKSTDGGETWTNVYKNGAKRVQQIVADPTNFDILYASVMGYGVIKSTDRGETWEIKSNNLYKSTRMEIAVSPVNPQKIFVSTYAGGTSYLYASADGAESWYRVTDEDNKNWNWLGSQGWYDNTIAAHPYNENIVFSGGIDIFEFEVRDGIDSVEQILSAWGQNTASLITYKRSGLSHLTQSFGTGDNFWDEKVAEPEDFVSINIRFGKDSSQMAHRFGLNEEDYEYKDYVEVPFEVWDTKNNKQLAVSFYDYDDNGEFDLLAKNSEMIFIHATDYDPDKENENVAVENGVKHSNIYVFAPLLKNGFEWGTDSIPDCRIIVNYGNWYWRERATKAVTAVYGYYPSNSGRNDVHPDQHNITIIPIDEETGEFQMVVGNDGGIVYSTDMGNTWRGQYNLAGYNTSQFYGADKCPGKDEYIGGTQDNGTWMSIAGLESNKMSPYNMVLGGDGFEVSWHYKDPLKIIGGSQFNGFGRTTNGGASWVSATKGLADIGSGKGVFITRIAKSQADPELLFAAGRSGLWRSENFAESWSLTDIPDSVWSGNGYFQTGQAEISIADPQVVWAGVGMSASYQMSVSTDAGLSFQSLPNYADSKLGRITGIETHPTDPKTAYMLFSFKGLPKIIMTDDLGETWSDFSRYDTNGVSTTGFPDVATYSLVVMPYNTDIIWAGTEIGLFETTDGGDSWHYADYGIPAVSIWQMRIVDDQIVAGTHGRGIWSLTIPELAGYKPPEVTLAPITGKSGQAPNGNLVIETNLRSEYDSTVVRLDNVIKYSLEENEIGMDVISMPYQLQNNLADTVMFEITSYKDGREYKSAKRMTILYRLEEHVITYMNDFEINQNDFVGAYFSVDTVAGFDNAAIHSRHNYLNQTDLIYMLRTPIVVADTNPQIVYDDVAIIETGQPGSRFGQSTFFDYIVMEATVDGLNWLPVADGYDSDYDPLWLEVYKAKGKGTKDLFVSHTVDLSETFEGKDTILIRFRLHGDPNTNGWGWACDNLNIQEDGAVPVKDYYSYDSGLKINFVSPNPIVNTGLLNYSVARSSNLEIKVYDIGGREIESIRRTHLTGGDYSLKLNMSVYESGVYFVRISNGNQVVSANIVVQK